MMFRSYNNRSEYFSKDYVAIAMAILRLVTTTCYISMLFAGFWSVRMVKNCDRGLENFQARGHSFSPYGPTQSRQITCLFFLRFVKNLRNE